MNEELLTIIREQNNDLKEVTREISAVSVRVARVEEKLSERAAVIKNGEGSMDKMSDRISELERSRISWKPLSAILVAFMSVMVVAMYLIAGGEPSGVKELIP